MASSPYRRTFGIFPSVDCQIPFIAVAVKQRWSVITRAHAWVAFYKRFAVARVARPRAPCHELFPRERQNLIQFGTNIVTRTKLNTTTNCLRITDSGFILRIYSQSLFHDRTWTQVNVKNAAYVTVCTLLWNWFRREKYSSIRVFLENYIRSRDGQGKRDQRMDLIPNDLTPFDSSKSKEGDTEDKFSPQQFLVNIYMHSLTNPHQHMTYNYLDT